MQGVLKVKRPVLNTRLKVVSNENCGWSGRWQMLGSGLGPRRSLFNCHFNMPFWNEKSISVCVCNNNMNRPFLSEQAQRGALHGTPCFSFFNLYFQCSDHRKVRRTEKLERQESRNDQKSRNDQEIRQERNDRCANILTERCTLRIRRCVSNSHRE